MSISCWTSEIWRLSCVASAWSPTNPLVAAAEPLVVTKLTKLSATALARSSAPLAFCAVAVMASTPVALDVVLTRCWRVLSDSDGSTLCPAGPSTAALVAMRPSVATSFALGVWVWVLAFALAAAPGSSTRDVAIGGRVRLDEGTAGQEPDDGEDYDGAPVPSDEPQRSEYVEYLFGQRLAPLSLGRRAPASPLLAKTVCDNCTRNEPANWALIHRTPGGHTGGASS